ncbi:MAG: transposase [Candidatus Aminicenantia bacterium]
MTRPLRIEYENAVYHITARGNEKRDIFLNKKDHEKFLFYLALVQERYKIIVYCYVLMENHYHLLIETPHPNLSRVMRDLNGHYTIYFNKHHKRCGHLFQGRYKAILVDKDNYLLELSRYIHLNPVRAGILSKPEDYKYSSMPYYVDKGTVPPWLNVNFILEQFGDTFQKQRNAYKEFVYEGVKGISNPLKNIYAQSILGSENFIKNITDKFLRKKTISKQVPKSKKLKYGKDLNDIAKIVMEYYNIEKEMLIRRKAKFNKGKKVFVYLARRYTDSDLNRIRNFLNNSITEVAVSKLCSRTQEELKNRKDFKKEVEEIEKQLFNNVDMYHVKT